MSLFEYPREGFRIDPFDVEIDDPQFLYLTNNGMSHAFRQAQTGDHMEASEFTRVIPMGYTALLLTQKLAVAADGEIVREWPLAAERRHGPYDGSWYERWGGYRVITPPDRKTGAGNDEEGARAALMAASRGGVAALLYVVSWSDWH